MYLLLDIRAWSTTSATDCATLFDWLAAITVLMSQILRPHTKLSWYDFCPVSGRWPSYVKMLFESIFPMKYYYEWITICDAKFKKNSRKIQFLSCILLLNPLNGIKMSQQRFNLEKKNSMFFITLQCKAT